MIYGFESFFWRSWRPDGQSTETPTTIYLDEWLSHVRWIKHWRGNIRVVYDHWSVPEKLMRIIRSMSTRSNVKSLDHFRDRDLECQNTSSQKFWNTEMRNGETSKWETPKISGFMTWSIETLHHKKCWNVEMWNVEIPFWCRQWLPPMVMWEGGASTKLSSISGFRNLKCQDSST